MASEQTKRPKGSRVASRSNSRVASRSGSWVASRSASSRLKGFVPGPKAVGSFVPKLAAKAFEKFGFATAAVLTDWPGIVGPQLAALTAPERLRWPRQADGDPGATASAGPRAGATLMLRVDPARALDVQYKTAQIIERINAYFGYAAVTEIRLIQAPLVNRMPPPAKVPAPGAKAAIKATLGRAEPPRTLGIEDGDLRQALERLGSAVGAAPHRHT